MIPLTLSGNLWTNNAITIAIATVKITIGIKYLNEFINAALILGSVNNNLKLSNPTKFLFLDIKFQSVIDNQNAHTNGIKKKIIEYAKYGMLNSHPKNPPLFFKLSILFFI